MVMETNVAVNTTDKASRESRPPALHSSIHMMTDAPAIEFRGYSYPTISISARQSDTGSRSEFLLSLRGDSAQRAAVAASLRAMADELESWL
jgi:hypothetical protein